MAFEEFPECGRVPPNVGSHEFFIGTHLGPEPLKLTGKRKGLLEATLEG